MLQSDAHTVVLLFLLPCVTIRYTHHAFCFRVCFMHHIVCVAICCYTHYATLLSALYTTLFFVTICYRHTISCVSICYYTLCYVIARFVHLILLRHCLLYGSPLCSLL